MLRHFSLHDQALLRACGERRPDALQELYARYYPDIYRKIFELLDLFSYPKEVIQDMAMDCIGKIYEDPDRVIARFSDLDTAVAKIAAAYARAELSNPFRRG